MKSACIEVAWNFTVIDIETTVKNACERVLKDISVC